MTSSAPCSIGISGRRSFTSNSHATNRNTIESGPANTSQSRKLICTSRRDSATPAKTAFGGLPIRVATPPIDALYAIPSINASPKPVAGRSTGSPRTPTRRSSSSSPSVAFRSCSSTAPTETITAIPIGTINIAVAEFEIHIERNAVAIMNPSRRRSARTPTRLTTVSAIRLWRSQRSIPSARRNPPRRRKTTGSAYGAVAPVALTTPVIGKRTIGRRLVAGIGIASVTHQAAIQRVLASAAFADEGIWNGENKRLPVNSAGPRTNPICCRVTRSENRFRVTIARAGSVYERRV